MAAPVEIFRGKASIAGCAGVFDAIINAIKQSGKATQNYELEEIKDEHGFDTVWVARNENLSADWNLKLVGDTTLASLTSFASAVAATAGVTTTGRGAGSTVSDLGQPFLAPLSVINFTASGSTPISFNGTYQILSGMDVDLANTKVGDLALKLRRYASAYQNAGVSTVPA